MAARGDSLFDDAAEESDDQEEEQENEQEDAEKQPKERSGSRAGSDVDSSDEEEGGNEYDMTDKFIAPEDEEDAGESESDEEGGRRKKKKRRRREDEELDEEDYALLEEQGVRVDNLRRQQAAQRKRIRKKDDAVRANRTAEEQVQHDLFGDEAPHAGLEDDQDEAAPRAERREMRYDDEGLDSEDDFIDDDIGDGTQEHRPKPRGKGRTAGVHNQAVQEAFDIFGDVGELLEMYDARRRTDQDEAAEQEPDFEDHDAEAADYYKDQEKRRQEKAYQKLSERIEPGMMAKHFMRPEDEQIRTLDVPEREQAYRGADPQNMDYARMAQWVHKKLVGTGETSETKLAEMLEVGVREVDGGHWHYRQLQSADRSTDLDQGFRGLTAERSKEAGMEWRESEPSQAALKVAIEQVLRLIYEEHYEVPFISSYRKESCGELLVYDFDDQHTWPRVTERSSSNHQSNFPLGAMQSRYRRIRQWQVMYAVQAFGDKWRSLERRKDRQRQAFEAAVSNASDLDLQSNLQEAADQVDQATSIEEVEDLERQLRLMSDNAAAVAAANGIRQLTLNDKGRSNKISAQSIARKAGLGPAAAAIFLQPSEFGENLETSTLQNPVTDVTDAPEAFTAHYLSEGQGFATTERVLDGMMKIAVAELGAEASVRRHLRELYVKHVCVSTEPTLSGEVVLDPFHPYGTVRHLRNKPVHAFTDEEQYLLIADAEKAGLLKVDFKVVRPDAPELKSEDALLQQLRELYCSQSVSTTAKAWNDIRERALRDALTTVFIPQFERELRARLTADARELVCSSCCTKVFDWAAQGPLTVKDRDDLYVEDRRFMVVVWGPGGQGPSTTLVMLDHQGAAIDFLYCGSLSGPVRKPFGSEDELDYSRAMEDAHKGKDLTRIKDFVSEHLPHVILIATASQHAEVLQLYMKKLADWMVSNNAQALSGHTETGHIDVMYVDQTVAQLWENSAAGREEFPDQPVLVRRGIALGRTALQGQLPIICSLAGMSREILALNMHPMQKAVSAEELYKAAERALVTVTCQVGVDVNLAAQTPWLAHQLQFVAGLGPRKAAAVLKAIQRQEQVASRRAVWKELKAIGKKVFWNAAGAVRIRRSAGLINEELDLLDDTRVHPESYAMASKFCYTALQGTKFSLADDEDQIAVEKATGKPELLESVDISALSIKIQNEDEDQSGPADNLTTLIDIGFELVNPYMELRSSYSDPSFEQTFWLLTGETADTLKPGRKVQATIQRVSDAAAWVTLSDINDISAVIMNTDISSSGEVRPGDRLRRGDVIPARVKAVQPRLPDAGDARVVAHIYLATTSNAMAEERKWEGKYCLDQYYRPPDEAEVARKMAERQKGQRKQQFVSRTIFHPSFKNVSMPDAISFLDQQNETISWVIRPSNKGTHQLSITMKLHRSPDGNGLFLHQDIREGRKQAGGAGGHLKLGTPLTIQVAGSAEPLTFEDLDDVIANFAEPYLENVRALVRHRKFQDGDWADLQLALQRDPARPAYKLGIRYESPGIFYLGFVLRNTPQRENFSVLPSGFYYRKKVYPTIDAVCNKFKAQPINPELAQQAAAMASQYGVAYQQPAVSSKATSAYPQDPAYGAAAGASQYSQAAYATNPYANGQYPVHAQPGYAGQPYAAAAANGAAANGAYAGYSKPAYAYQQAAEAQAPPAAGAPSWAAQYANTGYAGYTYPPQATGYDAYASQPKSALPSQYPSSSQPPPPPSGGLVPPPPPT